MLVMVTALRYLLGEEEAQGLAEYGLILALAAMAVAGAVTALGEGLINGLYTTVNNGLRF